MVTEIALQLYTLREHLKTPADIAASLKKVRQIGYQAVQVSGIGPIPEAELKKICDGEGLQIAATHEGLDVITNKTDELIARHKTWACAYTACPYLANKYHSEEGFKEIAKKLTVAGEKLAAAGITLTYHNHAFEFHRYNGRTGLEIIYAESDPKFLQSEIDTYWVQFGGGDPVDWCRRLKGRLPLVHFKDYVVFEEKPTFAEVGEGNLNWPAIVAACREAGTKWYIPEQDICRRDPFESVKISYQNMRKLGLS